MRALIQRVKEANVEINGSSISEIGAGLLVFVGICDSDNEKDIEYLTSKIFNLRIFDDDNGVMNLSVKDKDLDIMVVSQFTLYSQTRKGNRPSYILASKPDIANPIYEDFCKSMELKLQKGVKKGIFGADMKVHLINDGPVTIWIDSNEK